MKRMRVLGKNKNEFYASFCLFWLRWLLILFPRQLESGLTWNRNILPVLFLPGIDVICLFMAWNAVRDSAQMSLRLAWVAKIWFYLLVAWVSFHLFVVIAMWLH